MNFKETCENLYQDWKAGKLEDNKDLNKIFQMDYLPEPYLTYATGEAVLYFLTTNPGAGLPFQHHAQHSEDSSYEQLSQELFHIYREKLNGQTAGRRIEGIEYIKKQSGFNGLTQVESCPFHSKTLPNKNSLPTLFNEVPILAEYTMALKEELKNKTVIALSATSTQSNIALSSIKDNVWLNWQADLMGFNFSTAAIKPLAQKDNRITSAFLYSRVNSNIKGFILVMGGNNIPKTEHLNTIAKVIREYNE